MYHDFGVDWWSVEKENGTGTYLDAIMSFVDYEKGRKRERMSDTIHDSGVYTWFMEICCWSSINMNVTSLHEIRGPGPARYVFDKYRYDCVLKRRRRR